MPELTCLSSIPLKEIWNNEATDFTPWLADNLQALGSTLGMELELVQREAPVGSFSVDLLATEIGTNRTIIIENQLDRTDHDHLGKVLTYAAGYNADVMIWLAQELREEHRQALDWLNQHTDSLTEFYGVEVELFRIGESRPAYNFEVVAKPNQWRKSRISSNSSRQVSERQEIYRSFFRSLIDRLREQHKFTHARAAQPQSWYSFSTGKKGLSNGANFAQGKQVRVNLYIDTGNYDQNKALYDGLFSQKEQIELAYGEPLSWERLDNKRASRVSIYRAGCIEDTGENLKEIEDWMVKNLIKIKDVVVPLA